MFLPPPTHTQQLAEESVMRVELQMALDSKDSDIEQLRGLLNSVNAQSLDSASMSSGPEFETDESLPGFTSFILFFSTSRLTTTLWHLRVWHCICAVVHPER